MGGLWYGITRVFVTPFVTKEECKKIAASNEKVMRKTLRETVVPVICAVSAIGTGPVGVVGAAAAGRAAASTIYPEDKD